MISIIREKLKMAQASDIEVFAKVRQLKDKFK
jgi:hypothetical protein